MSRRFTQTAGKHMGGLGLYSSGNAWTEKDREDLFTRRKNGEDWVSICQDYPNRSIRALEQQCSLYGRKNGIPWTTVPAKRKSSERREQPSRAASSAPRFENANGESPAPGVTGSPFKGPTHLAPIPSHDILLSTPTGPDASNLNGEAASTSNVIPRSIETNFDVKAEPKPAGPVSNVAAPFVQETGEGATMTDTTMSNSEAPPPATKQPRAARPYKRRKKSPVPSYRNFMVRTADQLIQPEMNIEDMPFDKTDLDNIQTAVQAAQAERQIKFQAQIQSHAAALEKLKKQYEAALGRANRRAFEANEKNRVLVHDFATLKKNIKIDMAESNAAVRAEMAEEHAKALQAQNAVNPTHSIVVKDAELPPVVVASDIVSAEGAVPTVSDGLLDGVVDDTVIVAVDDSTIRVADPPASNFTNGLVDGSTDTANAATGTAEAPVNGITSKSIIDTSEITNLQAELHTATQSLEQERSMRQQDNDSHSEIIVRLSNEVQNLRNAQVAPHVETKPDAKVIEDLRDFGALKEDIMQLARQFPTIFSVDTNAEWSSAKVGLALHDLVHSRLKQEAQVKVHELLEQRSA